MIPSWLDPWPDFDAIYAEVWRTMKVAYTWPRHLTPPWHSPRQLGRRLFLPLPRSGIGGWRSTPAHLHTHTRTH